MQWFISQFCEGKKTFDLMFAPMNNFSKTGSTQRGQNYLLRFIKYFHPGEQILTFKSLALLRKAA